MSIARNRLNPYDSLPNDLIYFDLTSLMEVEDMAKGMAEEEVLAYYTLEMSELQGNDLKWFLKAFKRGRAKAKHVAVNSLFQSMGSRQAKEASIAYLQRFGKEWPEAKEDDGRDRKNFSFTVVLDE